MRRIELTYGGVLYTIADRDLDQVKKDIVSGLAAGPSWLTVNYGEGLLAETDLLLVPGVPIAVASVGPSSSEE